jgi:two-component system, LytTR family, response regulator
MLSCIIIDDEKYARSILHQLIRTFLNGRLEVLDAVSSVPEGVVAIKKHNPDLVFLDIEMPGQNGFALLDHFKEIPFRVVFCTAYEHYAIDAIKVAAFDYLIKPVKIDDLKDLMDRIENLEASADDNKIRTSTLLHNVQTDKFTYNSIALPTKDGYQIEKIHNIIYCRAQESYCKIHLAGNFNYLVSRSLKQMELILPADMFFRIHKSFLINLNYLHSYKKAEGYIVLHNGEELEVATRRSEEFLKRLIHRQ